LSVNIGSLVGTLKVIDEASGVIGKVQAGIGGLTGIMSKMGGAMGDVGGIINSAFSGFATGGPAGAALGAGVTILGSVVTGIQSCVKEATASEAVWASLGAAVGRTGESWQALKKGTEDALLAMSKVTTYSDEQLAQALEKLMTFGLSYDQAMQALGKTIDFAAAKHMDLESAATIVGKAMDGNTSILKRYGVDITTTKDATAALKDAHDAAKIAIDGMGTGVDGWVTSITTAIGATTDFQTGLAGAKDKAGYLIDQFQQGNIDLPQFTAAMTSLGVPLDETKLKAGSAEEVLGALNKQFGGAAQEQAKTYAGVQERLKNATGEVAEKIGTMFLPALASLAEGMIPVVDGLGKGIDAIGSWLTEVGKMPKVKGFVDAAQGAFDGLWKGMQDFWGFLSETFGPVLQELGGALREVFDALAPIGQAFGEVWAAITGGQEGGDWLKDFLKFVAQFIREVVVPAIKEAVPIIRGFAEAFKAAADFALPIITQIKDAVVGFIDALKDAFYGFYQWLVGGSLWMDMWNALVSVASSMIGTLIGNLRTQFFEPMKNAFTGALQAVENIWNTGWQNVQTAFATISTQVGTALNTKLEEMKTAISTSTSEYAPIATQALNGMQSAVNAGMDLIKGDWQGALDHANDALSNWGTVAKGAMDGIMGGLQGAVKVGLDTIKGGWDTFVGALQSGVGTLQSALDSAGGSVQQTLAAVGAATDPATSTVTTAFTDAFGTILTAATNFWNWLTGHSLRPEQLGVMQTVTQMILANIQLTFQQVFTAIQIFLQTILLSMLEVVQACFTQMTDTTTVSLQTISDIFTVIFSNIQVFVHSVMQAMLLDVQNTFALMIRDAQAALVTMLNIVAQLRAALAEALASRQHMLQIAATAPTTATAVTSAAGLAAWPTSSTGLTGALLDAWKDAIIQMNPGLASVTLPINVTIDGQTVSRVVEQRLISQQQVAG